MVPANAIHPIHSHMVQLSCQDKGISREAKLPRGIILLPKPQYSLCLHLGGSSVLDEVDMTCLATAGSLPKHAISYPIKQHQTSPLSALYLPPFIPFYREWEAQPLLGSPALQPPYPLLMDLPNWFYAPPSYILPCTIPLSSSSALQDLRLQLSPDIHLILVSWHPKVLSS